MLLKYLNFDIFFVTLRFIALKTGFMKISTINFKKLLPYIVAIFSFMLFSMIYFAPQYSGQVLQMDDMQQVGGMSRDINEHIEKYGENPQWTGTLFGGMPSYLISMNYDGRLMLDVSQWLMFLGDPSAYFFVAMLAFFFMLLCFGVNPWLAIIGAFGYGLSTYFYLIINVGHITKMIALAFAPALVGGVLLTYRKHIFLGAALTAFFAAIELSANHIQITYYFAIVILALFINELVRAIKLKTMRRFMLASAALLFAAVLSIGANFNQIYYIAKHSSETIRGGSEVSSANAQPGAQTSSSGLDLEYATQWSYGRSETFNLFIPNFMGGGSAGGFTEDGEVAKSLKPYGQAQLATQLPAYWGTQPFTAGPVYIGATLIFLFVLGMFILRGSTKWWIFGVSVLSILLAWGSNFMWLTELLYNYLPFYDKFRTPAMILVIVEFTVPLLAVLSLQAVMSNDVDKALLRRGLRISTLVVGGLALFFVMMSGTLFDFSSPNDSQLPLDVATAMRSERVSMFQADSFRSLAFVLLTALCVYLWSAGKLKNWIAISALAALVIVDITPVNLRYLNYDNFHEPISIEAQPSQADIQIMKDTELGYRVANFSVNMFNDAMTSNFHRSVGGYHPAKLSRYQDLIDRYLSRRNMAIYNMMNAKYIIGLEGERQVVMYNPDALGAAWFVDNVSFTKSAIGELERIGEVDLRTTAVVDEMFQREVKNVSAQDTLRNISLVDYKANELTYRYNSDSDQVAVFSEIYYPRGWTAYVDGVETPYFRANYVLRAMSLPSGEHTVVFKFKVPDIDKFNTLTLMFSICVLSLLAAAVIYVLVKKRKNVAR